MNKVDIFFTLLGIFAYLSISFRLREQARKEQELEALIKKRQQFEAQLKLRRKKEAEATESEESKKKKAQNYKTIMSTAGKLAEMEEDNAKKARAAKK